MHNPNSVHHGGQGDLMAVFATPQEIAAKLAEYLVCSGVALDGNDAVHTAFVVWTADGWHHIGGDLGSIIAGDEYAHEYLATLPRIAEAQTMFDGLPGLDTVSPATSYTVPEATLPGRHRKVGRIMRAIGFRS